MPRALVTGITGQDGLYLAELLLSKGYDVFGLIRGQNNPKEPLVRELVPDVTLISGDLQDLSSLLRAMRGARSERLCSRPRSAASRAAPSPTRRGVPR